LLIKMLLYIGNSKISLDLQEISKRVSHFCSKVEQSKDVRSVSVGGNETELEGCETARLVLFKLYK
jgi:hypothetical protein